MLPRSARMRLARDFRQTVRRGVRAARPTLVVHAGRTAEHGGVQVGFVVSRAVGSAVRRNQVKRLLRHLAAAQLAGSPSGIDVVVRALPRAGSAPDDLRVDLPAAWTAALHRLEPS